MTTTLQQKTLEQGAGGRFAVGIPCVASRLKLGDAALRVSQGIASA